MKSNPQLTGLRILLVEDNTQLRRIMVKTLTSFGAVVHAAANGQEALEALEGELRFELLLSDIRMPGRVDGITLAESAARRFPRLPILLQTGFSGNQLTRFPTLEKPFTPDELIAAIKKTIADCFDASTDSQS